jgi:LmbE family N-acetylglucosaminyl deacetylase
VLSLRLGLPADRPPRILCLGAHSDDIEIGCGGTLMHLIRSYPGLACRWVVWSAIPPRDAEARQAASGVLATAGTTEVVVEGFRDGHFPDQWTALKARFEEMKDWKPDLVFTHHRQDRHQDHRVVAELTWNTWRDHLILEYEVVKYEGDLHTPNVYVSLERDVVDLKVSLLMNEFPTQRSKPWFDPEVFRGLMRIRGVECGSPSGYAEGFHAPKMLLTSEGA